MEKMKPFRERIDTLDDQIVDLIVERIGIIHDVAAFKFENDIPAVLQDRVDEVIDRNGDRAKDKGSDETIIRELYTRLVKYSCDLEEDIMSDLKKKRA